MKHDYRFPCMVLVWALATGWPLAAMAAAGLVQFAAGEVQVRRGDVFSALARGAAVDGGDVILTGSTGRGGLRAVTGLIGKRNPANYKMTTPTAVVGIRGSSFHAFFNVQGQLEVAGEQDAIEVCTQAGCVDVMAGESVRVLSGQQPPVYTNTRAFLPLPQARSPFAVGDQIRQDGSNAAVVLTPPPPVIPSVPPGQPTTPYVPPTPARPVTPGVPVTPGTPPPVPGRPTKP